MTQFIKPLRSSTNLDALEHSIVKLLIDGNTIKEIAASLNKTKKVIEYRLKKIRNIFSAKTNSELGYRIRELYVK